MSDSLLAIAADVATGRRSAVDVTKAALAAIAATRELNAFVAVGGEELSRI